MVHKSYALGVMALVAASYTAAMPADLRESSVNECRQIDGRKFCPNPFADTVESEGSLEFVPNKCFLSRRGTRYCPLPRGQLTQEVGVSAPYCINKNGMKYCTRPVLAEGSNWISQYLEKGKCTFDFENARACCEVDGKMVCGSADTQVEETETSLSSEEVDYDVYTDAYVGSWWSKFADKCRINFAQKQVCCHFKYGTVCGSLNAEAPSIATDLEGEETTLEEIVSSEETTEVELVGAWWTSIAKHCRISFAKKQVCCHFKYGSVCGSLHAEAPSTAVDVEGEETTLEALVAAEETTEVESLGAWWTSIAKHCRISFAKKQVCCHFKYGSVCGNLHAEAPSTATTVDGEETTLTYLMTLEQTPENSLEYVSEDSTEIEELVGAWWSKIAKKCRINFAKKQVCCHFKYGSVCGNLKATAPSVATDINGEETTLETLIAAEEEITGISITENPLEFDPEVEAEFTEVQTVQGAGAWWKKYVNCTFDWAKLKACCVVAKHVKICGSLSLQETMISEETPSLTAEEVEEANEIESNLSYAKNSPFLNRVRCFVKRNDRFCKLAQFIDVESLSEEEIKELAESMVGVELEVDGIITNDVSKLNPDEVEEVEADDEAEQLSAASFNFNKSPDGFNMNYLYIALVAGIILLGAAGGFVLKKVADKTKSADDKKADLLDNYQDVADVSDAPVMA